MFLKMFRKMFSEEIDGKNLFPTRTRGLHLKQNTVSNRKHSNSKV